MTKEAIHSRLQNKIGHLFLNRPESRNAITKAMWLAIPELMAELEKNGAEILVLEGAGDSFAAGADVTELKDLESMEDVQSNWDAIAHALNYIYSTKLPTIAAIDGACMGGGCLVANACDLRYASKRSRFAIPIAKLGITLDDVNLGRLSSLVGVSKAKELIFRGNVFTAAEAQTWGLVNDVFENYEFASRLNTVLAEISANATGSIREAKASFTRIVKFEDNAENREAVLASYLRSDFKSRIKWAFGKD